MWNSIPETMDCVDLRELDVRRFQEQAISTDENIPFYEQSSMRQKPIRRSSR
jgi:hypothetical protein